MRWHNGALVLFLCFVSGCASVSHVAPYGAHEEAFYQGTDEKSNVFWTDVLNDGLAARAFCLYSAHTMGEYAKITERQGRTLCFSIHSDGHFFDVDGFPVSGYRSTFVVDKDEEHCRMTVIDRMNESPMSDRAKNVQVDEFNVVVRIDANLVKRYFEKQFDPLVVYPFLGEALDNLSTLHKGGYLVAPSLKIDDKVLVYDLRDGTFWEVSLPPLSDADDIRFFVEHTALFSRAVDGLPTAEFWESGNLVNADAKFLHSYLVKQISRLLMRRSGL